MTYRSCNARVINTIGIRGDSLFLPTPIMGDIWKMIQDAKVVLAELTSKNANVFYELGLAHAIGKPVVLISETMQDFSLTQDTWAYIIANKLERVF